MDSEAKEDPKDNELLLVEVLKPFTAMNACYNPAEGDRPADKAAFSRKHAEYQAKKGLSRILGRPEAAKAKRNPAVA
jgi:hypothetical protein